MLYWVGSGRRRATRRPISAWLYRARPRHGGTIRAGLVANGATK